MGCASSKLDDLPAVSLCRERCASLDEAIRQRFAFAEAHVAYLESLKCVGASLDRFFSHDPGSGSFHEPESPVLNLPAQRKGGPDKSDEPSGSEKVHHLDSHSDSGSHLHFDSDDDSDGSGSELHHHGHDDDEDFGGVVHHQPPPYAYGGYMPGEYGNYTMNVNYMRNQTTPSVVYTARPMSPETRHMGEQLPYPYSNYGGYYGSSVQNPNPNPQYPSYGGGGGGGGFYQGNYGGGGGFYGGGGDVASTSKTPPSPPPPPQPSSSTWDFLNPFESFEKYYPPYTPSRDSREVREEEGIPELEDEEDEVVKEVHGNQKFVDSGRSSYSKPPPVAEEDARGENDAELQYNRARPSESDPVEYEVHVVDKKVVDAEGRSKDQGSGGAFKFKGDAEVVREIHVQFERAAESGSELAKILEVGKLQYKRKHGGHVSSKILHLPMMSAQSSAPKSSDGQDQAFLEVEQDIGLRSKSLSSTLHKLYLWEKKMYEEVKAEEKMRVFHDQKDRKLKRLDEKGAETQKIDATRMLVRSLSTKIRMAIQVVDRISVKINNLRDEELWPQLNEFIHGLTRMWKSMLECHHSQCQAIGEAKRLDAIAFRKHFSDSHFEATRELEHDLVNWTMRFSYWVGAQKGYVRALNSWLMKCLLYEPEETPDGPVPFSPGRIGAPPVFIVCNQWWQSLETVSEKEVVDSMREFVSNVLQLWDRDKTEIRQRMLANKEERKIRSLDKEEQKIQKEIQALDKRMVLASQDDNGMPLAGHVVYQSETTKGGSLQASLQHVLEAMERFTANSLKVYEELLQRIEEDHLARGHERAS